MNIIKQSAAFAPKTKTVVTAGTFDGVHLGPTH
jgi:FAD synthase